MNNCDSSIDPSFCGKMYFLFVCVFFPGVIMSGHRNSHLYFFVRDKLKWPAIYLNVEIKFVFNVGPQTTNEY